MYHEFVEFASSDRHSKLIAVPGIVGCYIKNSIVYHKAVTLQYTIIGIRNGLFDKDSLSYNEPQSRLSYCISLPENLSYRVPIDSLSYNVLLMKHL